MKALKRENNERWDWSRIIGVLIAVLGVLPFVVWLFELVRHVATAPAATEFQPALNPKDVWYMVFPALGLGLGLAFGKGRELTNALIDRIRGGSHG